MICWCSTTTTRPGFVHVARGQSLPMWPSGRKKNATQGKRKREQAAHMFGEIDLFVVLYMRIIFIFLKCSSRRKSINMSRAKIILDEGSITIPITPIDSAWSEDGRVFVKYKDTDFKIPPQVVGHVYSDTQIDLEGRHTLTILSSGDGYTIPVRVQST